MDESVFYISEGDPADKHSQESFGHSSSVHSSQQHAGFRQADCPQNGACLSGVGAGERLFVASPNKALINVYSWGKESPDQRIPIPEQLSCLTLCKHPRIKVLEGHQSDERNLPSFRTPWLLAGGSKTGKLYVWELASGNLLCVKEAHYQAITAIKFSQCGTFLVSGSSDARCMVWRTSDLISVYNKDEESSINIKPFASFTDHSLPITDLTISEAGIISDLRLYTVSRDSTLRIYDIMTKSLLTTFVLPSGIECVTKDPANRACYVGLSNGLIRTVPLYQINPNTSVLESIGGRGKIVTLDTDPNLLNTFVHHQQRLSTEPLHKTLNKKTTTEEKPILVTRLSITMDGSNLISGDSAGRVYVSDIVSRQVVKTFAPCKSSISYIQVNACAAEKVSVSNTSSNNNDKRHRLIPQFKRVLANPDPLEHQLYMEIPKQPEDEEDFESWLARKSQEELEFKNLTHINSSVTVTGAAPTTTDSTVKELEEKLAKVSKAYTDLRGKHEELYEEHNKLLSDS